METPIYICFAATNEWWARGLRWLLRSPYNHLFVLFFSPLWATWHTIDITSQGVQILPAGKSFSRVRAVECWKSHKSFVHGLQACNALIGSKYDWGGLIVNIARLIIWRIFGSQWRTPLHSITRFMCFEFGITLLQYSGITGAFTLEPSVTPPEELRAFLAKDPRFSIVRCPLLCEDL